MSYAVVDVDEIAAAGRCAAPANGWLGREVRRFRGGAG
jgi:hypothetical protein